MSDAILLFSKPITYAVTLSELGEEVVHKYQVQIVPKYEKNNLKNLFISRVASPLEGRSTRSCWTTTVSFPEGKIAKTNCKLTLILLLKTDKPHNPLINSGALVSASLILQVKKNQTLLWEIKLFFSVRQMVKPELQDMAQKYDYLFHLFEVILFAEHTKWENWTCLSRGKLRFLLLQNADALHHFFRQPLY